MSSDIQQLAVQYGAAWAALDLDAVIALHTEDTVFHSHGDTPPATGVSATREAFAAILAQWPDLRFERRRVHLGESHFVSEYEMSGTAGSQPFACDGVDVIVMRDGRVARKDSYLDWPALQRQLGDQVIAAGRAVMQQADLT